MNSRLRGFLKQLPYFLLHNYPNKLKTYYKISKENRKFKKATIKHKEKRKLNGYKSPSPLNELCEYVETWEKKRILWDNKCIDTRYLIVDNSLDLGDKAIIKQIRSEINHFAHDWGQIVCDESEDCRVRLDAVLEKYRGRLSNIVDSPTLLANYVISVSYMNKSISKTLAWVGYGDTIIENLKRSTPITKRTTIIEVPYESKTSYEFLGKYYEVIEVMNNGI